MARGQQADAVCNRSGGDRLANPAEEAHCGTGFVSSPAARSFEDSGRWLAFLSPRASGGCAIRSGDLTGTATAPGPAEREAKMAITIPDYTSTTEGAVL